jgi:ABC-2 type transport system permease protein
MSVLNTKYSHKDTGWRLFFTTIIARAYPRIIGQQRETSWMIFEVVMPMLGVTSYVMVYRALNAPEEYIGFVVMGGAMTAFWMNVLWSMSSQLYWEKEQGNLALYIMAPNSMMAILLGMALGGMLATMMRALAVTIFGSLMFGVTYQVVDFFQLFAVFMLAMVAWA